MDRIAAPGGEDLGVDTTAGTGIGIGTSLSLAALLLVEGPAGRHSVDSEVGVNMRPKGVVDDKVGGELEATHDGTITTINAMIGMMWMRRGLGGLLYFEAGQEVGIVWTGCAQEVTVVLRFFSRGGTTGVGC